MSRSAAAIAAILAAVTAVPAAEGTRARTVVSAYADAREARLLRPEGVAFDGAERLVVADTGNGRLVPFTIAGAEAKAGAEIRIPQVTYPVQVQVAAGGDLLVLDGRRHQIARLSPVGEFRGWIEPHGDAAAGTIVPRSFKVDAAGAIYLLDAAGGRVLVLDGDGTVRRQVTFAPETGFLSDLAVDGRGTLFAIDSTRRRAYVARPDDAAFTALTEPLVEDMSFPTALAVDATGRLCIADQRGGGLVFLGADGSFRGRQSGAGAKEGSLLQPSGLAVSGSLLAVADRGNNRVQIFTLSD